MARRRRRVGAKRRAGGRRHHRSGGGRGLGALKSDASKLLVAAVYGKIEALAASDDNFVLNKIPRPIAAVGYTGNIALALYAATYFSHNHWLRQSASVVATIAAYKMGKQGKAYDTSDKTSIGVSAFGLENDEISGDERVIDEHVMGALDAEAREFGGESESLSYENAVQEAGART